MDCFVIGLDVCASVELFAAVEFFAGCSFHSLSPILAAFKYIPRYFWIVVISFSCFLQSMSYISWYSLTLLASFSVSTRMVLKSAVSCFVSPDPSSFTIHLLVF